MKSSVHQRLIPSLAQYLMITASLMSLWIPLAKASSPAVSAGNLFFHKERIHTNGQKVSCASCHTSDPRNKGMTRANKVIAPLAPSANPERFTDPVKVEKWFLRNCQDVLERPCTAQEKSDFIEYLRSVH